MKRCLILLASFAFVAGCGGESKPQKADPLPTTTQENKKGKSMPAPPPIPKLD